MKYILVILFSGVLGKGKWINRVKQKAKLQLWLRYNVVFDVDRIRLADNKIEIRGLVLETDKKNLNVRLQITKVYFNWNLRRLIRLNFQPNCANLIEAKLVVQRSSSGHSQRDIEIEGTPTLSAHIIRLLNGMRGRSLRFVPSTITISDAVVSSADPVSHTVGNPRNAEVSVKAIKVNVSHEAQLDRTFLLNFNFEATNLEVASDKIARECVSINCVRANFSSLVSPNAVIVKAPSYAMYEELKVYFALKLDALKDVLILNIKVDDTDATSVLRSILCSRINAASIQSTGKIGLIAHLMINLQNVYDYKFKAKLLKTDFLINDLGNADFNYLKEPFLHQVFDDGRLVGEILLDKKNDDFVVLEEISSYLIHAVLCTEDPNFYLHNGVDEKFFGFAIATNICEKKFSRGGSTITMQLVRNLFLNHKKTVFRKLEEIILAWTLEEICEIPKARLIELYLNIIELGPSIYGISQASQFYFEKRPAELTLLDSLVLTYIIPRPKYFLEALQMSSPQLIANLKKHVQVYSQVMFKRGIITESQLSELVSEIQFARHINTRLVLN